MNKKQTFDILIIGGGHAGTEAALICARMNCRTLLITHRIQTLGEMSCNPAIGGIGKSHLVREIDSLDGIMAKAADKAGIQFRVLNASKGPAVRATRAQCDRLLYKKAIRKALEHQKNLSLLQDAVDNLILKGDKAIGVITEKGSKIHAKTIVLAAGTFLGGEIHVGKNHHPGGRRGDPPALTFAKNLRKLPFRVARLKTGTPPRLNKHSIDFRKLKEQPGDVPRPVFSFLGSMSDHPKQISCFMTKTNEKTHEIILKNIRTSAMYSGNITGVGPRYCPSIEDKVTRFADRTSHQIFLEPEGLNSDIIYPNGISTSLDFEVQKTFVHSISGLENAEITVPGYAIEYDFFDPRDLHYSLETKHIENLFFAGQINGTTGYEEAGAQGLIAGLNAARKVQGLSTWTPKRNEAYIGVLIDDLITCGTLEPYRMFTSRAEYRLLLREDNADLRLTAIGRELGCVGDERWQTFEAKRKTIETYLEKLKKTFVHPNSHYLEKFKKLFEQKLDREFSAFDLLKRPEINFEHLIEIFDFDLKERKIKEQIEIQAKYAGYIARQEEEIERQKQFEHTKIPKTFNYNKVPSLSNEIRQKLTDIQPETLGQAIRISGITPAAISVLRIYLKKNKMNHTLESDDKN